jgi:NADP-dependent aldehyde dehydrogenase
MREPALHHEVFGAASLLVRCRDFSEKCEVTESLAGRLTATVHAELSDWPAVQRLIPALERKSGRIVVNGFPIGVEVCDAMVHGGPYPSTSDGRSSSVGSLAIQRFLRPVCYQDMPGWAASRGTHGFQPPSAVAETEWSDGETLTDPVRATNISRGHG